MKAGSGVQNESHWLFNSDPLGAVTHRERQHSNNKGREEEEEEEDWS